MSDLIAIAYPDRFRAAEVMSTVSRLQMEHLLDLEDACYVTKNAAGEVKLHQAMDLTTAGAVSGAIWGTLIGTFFLMPLAGLAVGAASGALSGLASDIGINDEFMKELGSQMPPDSSALFILVRQSTPDRVIAEMSQYGGTILRTNLSVDAEAKLKAAFSKAQEEAGITSPTPVADSPAVPPASTDPATQI